MQVRGMDRLAHIAPVLTYERPIDFLLIRFATTAIYTLSLHDALPICCVSDGLSVDSRTTGRAVRSPVGPRSPRADRKSTRLNSSHTVISYAVFCLKKKNQLLTPHAGPEAAQSQQIFQLPRYLAVGHSH